jgi:MazG family protein
MPGKKINFSNRYSLHSVFFHNIIIYENITLLSTENKMKELNKLIKIMKKLRDPVNGCPWDLKQTPASLKEYTLEEAHELMEAIDQDSAERQKEELGDLLLQIVFLSRIHQEKNHFSIRDVIRHINDKLIRRHPHVFGDTSVHSAEEVKANWQKIKKKEKKRQSIISDYPESMPALVTAKRMAEQASSVGFDWDDPLKALEKVEEEIAELKRAIPLNDREKLNEEVGDLLFAVANVARLLHLSPEFSLKQANQKFKQRFRYIEDRLRQAGQDIEKTSLDHMEALWQQAKSPPDK